MGFELRVRFNVNPRVPRPYDPGSFLSQLDTDPPSLSYVREGNESFEYRRVGHHEGMPAVVVSIEPTGLFICEYDRRVGTQLLGAIVKFALWWADDERVTIEEV